MKASKLLLLVVLSLCASKAQFFSSAIQIVAMDPSGACTGTRIRLSEASGNVFYCNPDTSMWTALSTSAASAPSSATYITQTANGSLSAEQALGALATGCLGSTTTTGVVAARTITGTASKITVTNGDCSGNPTITIPDSPTLVTPNIGAATGTSLVVTAGVSGATYSTATNCADSAGDAACAAAPAGSVVIDAADTDTVVSTTAVTANSQIFVFFDASLGTRLSVTCNTTVPSLYGVTARTAGASFTITATAPVTNPACFGFLIVN